MLSLYKIPYCNREKSVLYYRWTKEVQSNEITASEKKQPIGDHNLEPELKELATKKVNANGNVATEKKRTRRPPNTMKL